MPLFPEMKPSKLIGLLFCWLVVEVSLVAAQNALWAGPTPEEYVARWGGEAKVVAAGELTIDGRKVICGRRPTVFDPKLDDYATAYPGFIILNPTLLAKVSLTVKLWIHAQACGYQHYGPVAEKADCFAAQRGRRQGWLTLEGLEDVCKFILPTKAGTRNYIEFKSGPERCEVMRACYLDPSTK